MEQTISKPHYVILEGLRGVAAIAVVIFHCYEWLTPDPTKNPIAHGYLAVDFFFCLSGFVIGYAYDKRISNIGLKQFFINRIIRLHPFVVLGTVLGLLELLLNPLATSAVQEFGWGKIIVTTICSLLLLPCPMGRYGNVFPLNAPAWSLSMEYFVNVLYALVLVQLNKKWLLFFLAVATAFAIYAAWLYGGFTGGWAAANYAGGFARVCFSFIAGLVIYRFGIIIKNNISFWVYAIVLVGIFLIPHKERDWVTETGPVVIVFPLIIALGAGTKAKGVTHKICMSLGNISYPLYMVHYWMIWILGSYVATKPGERNLYLFAGAIVVAALILAWLAFRFFDEPIRKWLTTNIKSKNIKSKI